MTAARHPAWLCVLAATACFHPSYDHPACGPAGECPGGLVCNAQQICDVAQAGGGPGGDLDAGVSIDGAALDGTAAAFCLGSFANLCVDPPEADVVLAQNIDTSSSPLCAAYTSSSGVDACVIAGRSISLPAGTAVRVTGARKLVLLASSSVTISGTLDAASHRNPGTSGPAADAGPCAATGAQNPSPTQGGGYGGSFGTSGNNGGNGGELGNGGIAAPAFTTTTLRAGCPGADGTGTSGSRGRGGGAVLVLAVNTITVDGIVNASGAAGAAGTGMLGNGGGAGGGGSGGMIVLEASTVTIPGKCFANGGGGGEGSSRDQTGHDGGESGGPAQVAVGGSATADLGGDGGSGAGGGLAANPGHNGGGTGSKSGSGGGGGGGTGVIKVISTDRPNLDVSHVSPLPS